MRQKFIAAQSGNAMIYILIAIVLFGVLTTTLSSQNQQADSQDISEDIAEFYTSEIMNYAVAAQNVVEQMMALGSGVNDLDFIRPNNASFDIGVNIHKVFHPNGGGLNEKVVKSDIFTSTVTDPAPGFYMGVFNNIAWTTTTAQDAVFTAYGINQTVCQQINEKITDSTSIPALTVEPRNVLIDDADHTGTNADLAVANCAACEGYPSLCVSNVAADLFVYYSILRAR